jgi:cytoskeletal protein CcmA (bactofilin family)
MFNLKMKRVLKLLCVGLALLFMLPAAALADNPREDWLKVLFNAESAKSGELVVLEASKTAKGPGFYAGKIVRLDGNVDGTAFAAGQEVTINGDINGDLFAAGQEVTVNGKVYGNLYAAGQKVLVKGQVTGDAFMAGEKAEAAKEAVFSRDMIVFAANTYIAGRVERQFFSDSHYAALSGSIGDNARLAANNLEIKDGAEIKGKLVYSSPNKALVSEKAKIDGGTEWKKVAPGEKYEERRERDSLAGELFELIFGIAGALLIWFIASVWRPDFWSNMIKPISDEPVKTMGIGALALILGPVLAIILMATVIGIPLALLLIFVYGFTIFLAKIIVAVFIGSLLARRFNWPVIHQGLWLALLGLAIIAVLTRIPFAGFLFMLMTVFWGLGAVTLAFIRPQPKL